MNSDLMLLLVLVMVILVWRLNTSLAGIAVTVKSIKENDVSRIYNELSRLNGVIMAHFKPHNRTQVGDNNELERDCK